MGKKKVVLDTNVIISALGWGGNAYEIITLGFDGAFKWIISTPIFEELIQTLNYPKFSFIEDKNKQELIALISEIAEFVETEKKLIEKFTDKEDIKFLECALEADADYIVSGDKHLLNLGKIGKTVIISPRKFLHIFP